MDFGGQYNQLIARRVREANVYSEILPYTASIDRIKSYNPKGIIFTGGPNSVNDPESPSYDRVIFDLGIPILGICYGAQLMAKQLGGSVYKPEHREYGHTLVNVKGDSLLFEGLDAEQKCWMSHFDQIKDIPDGFVTTAVSGTCPHAAMENPEKETICCTVSSRSGTHH